MFDLCYMGSHIGVCLFFFFFHIPFELALNLKGVIWYPLPNSHMSFL